MLTWWKTYREREIALRHDEQVCLISLRGARASVAALEAARKKGHDVEESMLRAQEDVKEIRSRMPRGHAAFFAVYAVLITAGAFFLHFGFLPMAREALEGIGGGDAASAIAGHERSAAFVRLGQSLAANPWILTAVAGYFLVLMHFTQRRLRRRLARALLLVACLALLCGTLLLVDAVFQLQYASVSL